MQNLLKTVNVREPPENLYPQPHGCMGKYQKVGKVFLRDRQDRMRYMWNKVGAKCEMRKSVWGSLEMLAFA